MMLRVLSNGKPIIIRIKFILGSYLALLWSIILNIVGDISYYYSTYSILWFLIGYWRRGCCGCCGLFYWFLHRSHSSYGRLFGIRGYYILGWGLTRFSLSRSSLFCWGGLIGCCWGRLGRLRCLEMHTRSCCYMRDNGNFCLQSEH